MKNLNKCSKCYYQEFSMGEFICKHICSVDGIEALEDYKKCKFVKSCEYFKKSEKSCKECEGAKTVIVILWK